MSSETHTDMAVNIANAFHILTDPEALHLHLLRNPGLISRENLYHLLGDEAQREHAIVERLRVYIADCKRCSLDTSERFDSIADAGMVAMELEKLMGGD